MNALIAVSNFLDKLSRAAITLFLTIITVVLFSQVVSRYLLDTGLAWSEELSRYLMIWMIFLGATVAAKEGSQISVTVLEDVLPQAWRKILMQLQKIISIIFFVLVTGFSMKILPLAKLQTSPNMGLPMHITYFVIPLASVIMIIHLVIRMYLEFREGSK